MMRVEIGVEETELQVNWLLRQMGVAPGDALLFHSSFSNLSHRTFKPDCFLDAVIRYLQGGTLALPSLSWREVSPEKPFVELETRSNVGILTEVFRSRYAQRRSLHPTHSVSALGPAAEFLTRDHHTDERPCSPVSPWGRLDQADAKILFIGVDFEYATIIHYLEEKYVPDFYLGSEPETFRCIDRSGVDHIVKTRRHKKFKRNYWKFKDGLRERGKLWQAGFFGTTVFGCRARDLTEIVAREFEENPEATLARPGEQWMWF